MIRLEILTVTAVPVQNEDRHTQQLTGYNGDSLVIVKITTGIGIVQHLA